VDLLCGGVAPVAIPSTTTPEARGLGLVLTAQALLQSRRDRVTLFAGDMTSAKNVTKQAQKLAKRIQI